MSAASARGFTIIELIAAVAIFGIVMSIGFANLAEFNAQMKASEQARRLALTLSSIRSEAIRLRATVRVTFDSSGYSWDFYDDGTDEGNESLRGGTMWAGSVPNEIVFNGLGLLQGANATLELSVQKGESVVTVAVNQNGYISL